MEPAPTSATPTVRPDTGVSRYAVPESKRSCRTSRCRTSPWIGATASRRAARLLSWSNTVSYGVCARAGRALRTIPRVTARSCIKRASGERKALDGGHRIRTCKGFRPPVFKTGALAIRPALPCSNLPRVLRVPKLSCGFSDFGICSGSFSSNTNGTSGCRFRAFFFDVLAEQNWNSIVTRPVTFRTVRLVPFPGKFLSYETLRNRHSPTCARQHALGGAGPLRRHRLHAPLGARAARHRPAGHLGDDCAPRRQRAGRRDRRHGRARGGAVDDPGPADAQQRVGA